LTETWSMDITIGNRTRRAVGLIWYPARSEVLVRVAPEISEIA